MFKSYDYKDYTSHKTGTCMLTGGVHCWDERDSVQSSSWRGFLCVWSDLLVGWVVNENVLVVSSPWMSQRPIGEICNHSRVIRAWPSIQEILKWLRNFCCLDDGMHLEGKHWLSIGMYVWDRRDRGMRNWTHSWPERKEQMDCLWQIAPWKQKSIFLWY